MITASVVFVLVCQNTGGFKWLFHIKGNLNRSCFAMRLQTIEIGRNKR